MTETCGDCKFWQEFREDDEREPFSSHRIKASGGFCRRYAPRPLGGGSGQGWSDYEWPATSRNDWCGEWEADRE